MSELQELFLEELADVLHAEGQLLKALPKMAKAANSPGLKKAFQSHLKETEAQVSRLKQVFEKFNKPAKAKKCDAMEGLLEEGKKIMTEWADSTALDAGLIAAAQKVEHYEIATYGCLCTWGRMLGNPAALKLLKQNMAEEEAADKKLTELAESCINAAANENS
ncbi:MAG: ferritin-like domain-containing protein [Verrucomicrobiales bacterium]